MRVPPTRRVNRGRGHSYVLDAEGVDGVTKVIKEGVPAPGLIGWSARVTAGYAVDNWDELSQINISERLRRLEQARFEDLQQASARGTTVHEYAMRLAAGEELEIPEDLTGHVDAYLAFAEEWEVRELLVEVPVFSRTFRYGGTLDLIADLKDGQRWLLDWKTSRSDIYSEAALQLSAYRFADFYLDADGHEQPLPEVDATGVVWLRGDGYDLIPVETSLDLHRVFLYAQQIARFRQEPRETYIREALNRPLIVWQVGPDGAEP